MTVFLIPFSVFGACCLAQFYFLDRVKRNLRTRHPNVFNGLVGKSLFTGNAINRFVWRRRDLDLQDPELTKVVKPFKLLMIAAYGAWGLCALSVVTGVAQQPLLFDWPWRHAAGLPAHSEPKVADITPNVPPSVDAPVFGIAFAVAFGCGLIYLVLAWRLCLRWNSARLGEAVTINEPLSVLGVIWWAAPATRDEAFLKFRVATRVAFVLALAGNCAVFWLAGSAMR